MRLLVPCSSKKVIKLSREWAPSYTMKLRVPAYLNLKVGEPVTSEPAKQRMVGERGGKRVQV